MPAGTAASPALYRSTPLETASGILCSGVRHDVPELPTVPPGLTPRAAMAAAMVPALERPPCVVSFSGGQDSSAVLAVAADTARRHGLPPPMPVTLCFPDVATAEESGFQEAVVRHLRLPDWERVVIGDELDLVGPYATAVLRRHGHVWPFNAHFHVPIFERATGGTVLTGAGGDELFWRRRWWRATMLLARRRGPAPRDLLHLALALSPAPVRGLEMRLRTGFPADLPWLRPAARRAVVRAWYAEEARQPAAFDAAVRLTWWRSRSRLILNATLAALAADAGVAIGHPLEGPDFIAAVLARRGAVGYQHRIEAMRDLFGDLLLPEVVERRDKARFDQGFWRHHSRGFAQRWDGHGVDPALVDVDVLRAIWRRSEPVHVQTWPLFQTAWLATDGAGLQ